MAAEYDAEGNYIYPEGFDPETGEWLEGFDEQREAWEKQYAEAHERWEAHTKQVARRATPTPRRPGIELLLGDGADSSATPAAPANAAAGGRSPATSSSRRCGRSSPAAVRLTGRHFNG